MTRKFGLNEKTNDKCLLLNTKILASNRLKLSGEWAVHIQVLMSANSIKV